MNYKVVEKILGLTFMLSAALLLVLKMMDIPNAYESWQAWIDPNISGHDGYIVLAGILAFELISLISRFSFGFLLLKNKSLTLWLFILLSLLGACRTLRL